MSRPAATPAQYTAVLEDERAIAAYIEKASPSYVDTEQIEEYFSRCGALLQYLPMEQIREGNPEGNAPSVRKQKKYAKLSLDTMPPIVVENGEVQDGNHRYRDAVSKGAAGMWCYVIMEQPALRKHLAALPPAPAQALSIAKPNPSPSF